MSKTEKEKMLAGELYVAANDGQISFGIGRVWLFFDGPTEFPAWLTKLNALAAATREVVEAMLDGKHVLGVMPTGAGKSLCYQLPA